MKTAFVVSVFATIFAADAFAADETIKIGAVYPMTGPVAYDGQTLLQGARVAVSEVNAAGGIKGKKIELVVEDGACIPAQSVAAAEKLISGQKVLALIGAFCSSSTGAVMDVAKRHGVPMVAGISTAPNLTERGNEYFFRIPATSAMLAKAFAKPMLKLSGGSKFGFLVVNDDWGRSIIESYSAALNVEGATIVAQQIYDTNDSDLFPYITNIKRNAPDAVVLAGNTQNAVALTEQIRQMGLPGKFFGEGSFAAKSYYKLVGQKGDGMYGLMAYVYSIDSPRNKAFVTKYQADYNDLPTTYAASGYHEVSIVADALRRANGANSQSIRDAVAQTDMEGLAGPIRFTKTGQGYGFSVYLTLSKDAQPVVADQAVISAPN
jgi:branched-chain amino acid transport system substrate-binding protein